MSDTSTTAKGAWRSAYRGREENLVVHGGACGEPERDRVHADIMLPPPRDRSLIVSKGCAHTSARCHELNDRGTHSWGLGCSAGADGSRGGLNDSRTFASVEGGDWLAAYKPTHEQQHVNPSVELSPLSVFVQVEQFPNAKFGLLF